MVKCLNIGENIGKPIYRSISINVFYDLYTYKILIFNHQDIS